MQAGNIYVTNTRFERSFVADATLVQHTSSFRRCVSIGSGRFLAGGGTRPTKVQNVYVQGWGNASNASQPIAAIDFVGNGPLQLFDAVFDSPLAPTSPIVHVSSYPYGGAYSPVIRANVTVLGCPGCPFVQPFDPYPVNNSTVVDLPPGDAAIFAAIPKLSAGTHFFTSSAWPMPGKVFDAVRDFGASTTQAESSGAIQACINAAAAAGARAMCYLPAGVYVVNRTLTLCGALPFSLTGGGAGFTTQLRWGPALPPPGAPPVAVLAAGAGAGCAQGSNVAVEKLNAFTNGGGAQVLDFVASGTASVPASPAQRHAAFTLPPPFSPPPAAARGARAPASSHVVFDSFYFQSAGGAVLHKLVDGDVVRGPLWDGNLEVLDSATATVLGSFYAIEAGGLVVARMDGASPLPPAPAGPGFLGFVTMVAASNEYDVYAFNSSSLATGDFYTETAHSCLFATGDEASPPGLLALHYAKFNLNAAPWGAAVVDGYKGVVALMGMTGAYAGLNVSVTGGADTRVVLAGNEGWVNTTTIAVAGAAQVASFLNICVAQCAPGQFFNPPEQLYADTLGDLTAAVDATRRLGALDVALNLPWL